MIPKKIHYCWFGRGPMSPTALKCVESWHRYMPDYEYVLWNEDNFDVNSFTYTKEAYDSGKYAFVSDVARLKALKEFGGIYFDVDFEVFKPFDDLLSFKAFAGFEGSKYNPVMMGVIASEPDGEWVNEQLQSYKDRHFLVDGKMDLTTNVSFISGRMQKEGFIPNGYFCPRLTTGEYRRTANTYCEHKGGNSSWAKESFKSRLLRVFKPSFRTKLILIKRKILG